MTKMTSQSRQYKERHHNCLQDIVIQHHLMVLFIIKVSLEVLITWDKGADKILASYMTPDHVHQFASVPKVKHGTVIVQWLARYIKGTSTRGLILKPDCNKSLEVYVDSDFAGNCLGP